MATPGEKPPRPAGIFSQRRRGEARQLRPRGRRPRRLTIMLQQRLMAPRQTSRLINAGGTCFQLAARRYRRSFLIERHAARFLIALSGRWHVSGAPRPHVDSCKDQMLDQHLQNCLGLLRLTHFSFHNKIAV